MKLSVHSYDVPFYLTYFHLHSPLKILVGLSPTRRLVRRYPSPFPTQTPRYEVGYRGEVSPNLRQFPQWNQPQRKGSFVQCHSEGFV